MYDIRQGYQKRVRIAFGLSTVFHVLLILLFWKGFPYLFQKREIAVRLTPYTEIMQIRTTPEKPEPPGGGSYAEELPEEPPEPIKSVIMVPDPIAEEPVLAEMSAADPEPVGPVGPEQSGIGGSGGSGSGRGNDASALGTSAGGEPTFDERPRVLKKVEPEYPRLARMAGVEGLVVLSVLVDEQGRLEDVQVIKSLGNTGCDEAAVKAVRQWVFAPATRQGKPVAARVTLPVLFNLKTTR
jgi:protein TonB